MNKTTGLIIGIIVLVVAGLGILWVILSRISSTPAAEQPEASQNQHTDHQQTNGSETTDIQSGQVTIAIENFAYTPSVTKIKKGTKVTWTNKDSVGHNAVAKDKNNTGGLPTTSPLLAKGQSFSFTFNQVGIFEYTCSPHPNMLATIEVVE